MKTDSFSVALWSQIICQDRLRTSIRDAQKRRICAVTSSVSSRAFSRTTERLRRWTWTRSAEATGSSCATRAGSASTRRRRRRQRVAAPRRACSRPPRSGYSWRARCLRLYAFYATHFWSIQGQFQSHHFLDPCPANPKRRSRAQQQRAAARSVRIIIKNFGAPRIAVSPTVAAQMAASGATASPLDHEFVKKTTEIAVRPCSITPGITRSSRERACQLCA